MRKYIIAVLIALMGGYSQAQHLNSEEVPQTVKQAFTTRHGQVKGVKWSKESAAEFEAEFKQNGVEMSSNFDAEGNWLVTETELQQSALPQPVLATVAREFAGFEIKEVEMVEMADDSRFYEVALAKGKMKYESQISSEGTILKKEEEKNDEEKD